MGNLGAEKAKNQGLGWQQGCGGGRIGESPRGKMGKNGESSRGKMGKNGEKWGKMGRKWGGNGGKGDQLHHPSFLISPHFSPFPPHFPPFSPIFPHFPPFFLAMGTLWVRLWVQYPPPEPGTSEPCTCMKAGTVTTSTTSCGWQVVGLLAQGRRIRANVLIVWNQLAQFLQNGIVNFYRG